ncbi:MAG: shikimate kinase [Eubacterium sp.]|nr:shikimate kinase [Eubacterium sp.]
MAKYGLIGEHLSHSYSPMIHKMFGDYEYDLLEVTEEELPSLLHSEEYQGFNVTIPYKTIVSGMCDEISNTAHRIGAVNTVVKREDGTLYGCNTDYLGFRYLMEKNKIYPGGQKCLIFGSGGASRTIQCVLEDLGAKEIVVISRNTEENYNNIGRHHDATILVNATPVGMYPDNLRKLVDLGQFDELKGVLDVIYNPARTLLILDAEARGIPCASGLDMLVAQAWESSELFQGTDIDKDEILEVADALRAEMQNMILIGMPGAGKTMLGRKMAKAQGREFLDVDDMVEEREGMSVAEIFAQKGEAYFRKIETEELEKACKRTGVVIATGGGVVKTKRNYNIIRQNGRVVWIKRDLDKLETDGRPLSISTPVQQLYDERKDLYESWSDYFIDNNQEMK